jgi:anti-sigma factor ChrR (cupin superfamily)
MSETNELPDDLRELAASYALGALDPGQVASFEQMLRENPVLSSEVASFQQVATELAHGAPLAQPAPRVKQELFARLQPAATASPAGNMVNVLVRASQGKWIQTPFPGVEIKRLFVDPVTGSITTLLKAAAGAIYPAHQHGGLEQVFVVDGDMIFDDHALDTGDYEASAGHTHHSAIRTTEGCLALIIHSPDDKVFPV